MKAVSIRRSLRASMLAAGPALLLAACGGDDAKPAPVVPTPTVTGPVTATPPPADADVLGARPGLPAPAPFTPPVPVAYKRPNGMTVWLLERHTLPIVSIELVVPAGAAYDPQDKGGLAHMTANMLDEGAGKRGALEISRDVDRLGATLHTGAYADYAFAQITTLKKNLGPASAILGDVVARPTFSGVEWKRVYDLWTNELKARQSDPGAVAEVVAAKQVFGTNPYGHPTSGTTKSAKSVSLEDVKGFYKKAWRPETSTVVIVGDIARAEVDPLLDTMFAGWKTPDVPAPGQGASPLTGGRKVVLVDRPDAPQSVIALVKTGVKADDPEAPPLVRVNGALGGSFTSRLNQDLREEHGWSYGAKSRFAFTRGVGIFVASAAVHTEHTGDALKAMLADVEGMAQKGLTDEEVEKTKLLARADLVESFEGVENATRRLSRNAGIGLAPDHEAKASARLYGASKDDLGKLAAKYVDPKGAVIVIVGPRAAVEKQLAAIPGLGKIESSGPEGE